MHYSPGSSEARHNTLLGNWRYKSRAIEPYTSSKTCRKLFYISFHFTFVLFADHVCFNFFLRARKLIFLYVKHLAMWRIRDFTKIVVLFQTSSIGLHKNEPKRSQSEEVRGSGSSSFVLTSCVSLYHISKEEKEQSWWLSVHWLSSFKFEINPVC